MTDREMLTAGAGGTSPVSVLWSIGRGVIFILGAILGYLLAQGLASFPGDGPRAVVNLRIYSPLVLALAAPVCWYLAVRGQAGDRWTLAYIGAWAVWFSVLYLAVLVF
jgi:hypothetical protein